jgi:hypothetical protein
MILNQLTHWRTSGTPDVFRETWAGHEWGVISHGQPHDAGFVQRVEFERPIKKATLSVVANLYTDGRLMLRLGINPQGDTNPAGVGVQWSAWLGAPWWMGEPRTLAHTVDGLSTNAITVFLRGATGGWPVRSNVSRWRDARLEVEYAEPEPEPDPDPPDPPDLPPDDPRKWAIERIQEIQAEVVGLAERGVVLLEQVGELAQFLGLTEEERERGQAWIDEFNMNRGAEGL